MENQKLFTILRELINVFKSKKFNFLASKGFYDGMSDEEFIIKQWKLFFGNEINLDEPKSLCEKLQWLKLYYRKKEQSFMADKYEAKKIVEKKLGPNHVIPTLGVWDSFDAIDFDELPDKFVLKPTNDSGGLIICRDKQLLNKNKAKKKIEKSISKNYYYNKREFAYKNIKPRIIAEPLIDSLGKADSIEYKTTCFNGRVAFVTICKGIAHTDFDKRTNDHFDKDFNKLDWYVNYKPAKDTPQKPNNWEEIINFAEILSKGWPYLRVDTYNINGNIVFGEMTFYTWAGLMHFKPEEWDKKLGDMLKLPERCIEE